MSNINKTPYELSVWEDQLIYVLNSFYFKTSDTKRNTEKTYYTYDKENKKYNILSNWTTDENIYEYASSAEYISSYTNKNNNFVYIDESGNEHEVISPTAVTVKYQYYTERMLGIIGSDIMNSEIAARNVKFTQNINGERKLTFSMYYNYVNDDNEKTVNPWCAYLINERKVKLKYENPTYFKTEDTKPQEEKTYYIYDTDLKAYVEFSGTKFDNKIVIYEYTKYVWYDFIIKNVQENSSDNTFSYECTDLAVSELSKTGFSIELDTELENNQGTVGQLASYILDGSDWQLGSAATITQTNSEALYKVYLTGALTGIYNTQDDKAYNNIPSDKYIYVYYTPFVNQPSNFYQFIYTKNQSTPQLCEDNTTIYIDNENTFDLYCTTIPQYKDEAVEITSYRGDRKVRTQKTVYDSKLEEYVGIYTDDAGKQFYGYTKTEYLDPTCAVDYCINGTNFAGTDYWTFSDNSSLSWEVFPYSTTTDLSENRKSYLKVGFAAANSSLLINDGITQNASKINSFSKGEQYVLRLKYKVPKIESNKTTALSAGTAITTNTEAGQFKAFVAKYDNINKVFSSTHLFDFTFNKLDSNQTPGDTDTTDYLYATAVCKEDITYSNLINSKTSYRIAIYSTTASTFYIGDCQFFKYYPADSNGAIAYPYSVPTQKILTHYYYYSPSMADATNDADEYTYIYSDYEDSSSYKPYYGEDNQYEKIRSISKKESNRFNLLQDLCETFECWAKFEVEHNSTGKIKIDEVAFYDVTTPTLGKGVYTVFNGTSFEDGEIYYILNGIEYEVATDTDFEVSTDTVPLEGTVYYYLKYDFKTGTATNYYYYENFKYIQNTATYDKNKKYYKKIIKKAQQKKVYFQETIETDNPVLFSYGVNLKSIQRTLNSSDIVTKIIVKNNSCEYATNGFCSISRARDNPLKENYAYDFDYYTQQGLINPTLLNNDLYIKYNGYVGLYPRLAACNKNNDTIIEQEALLSTSITNQTAYVKTYRELYKAAADDLDDYKKQLQSSDAAGYNYYDFDNLIGQSGRIKISQVTTAAKNYNNLYKVVGPEGSYVEIKLWTSATSKEDKTKKNPLVLKLEPTADAEEDGKTIEYGYDLGSGLLIGYTTGYTATNYTNALTKAGLTTKKYSYIEIVENNNCTKLYNSRAYDMIDVSDGTYSSTVAQLVSSIQVSERNVQNYLALYTQYQKELTKTQSEYQKLLKQAKQIAIESDNIEREFTIKYSRYILEGSWTDDNYLDDNLYYLDALNVLYTSAFPEVSYTIDVIDLSSLDGYSGYKFNVGDKTYIEDTEFFGWTTVNGVKTPAREEVIVSEIEYNLDDPSSNKITVQNYKTQFEDLFQRISATTQAVEYHSGEYANAAGSFTSTGEIETSVLQSSLNNASYVIQNALDQTVTWGDDGITITKKTNPSQIVRLTSGGIAVSSDCGQTWSSAINGNGINASLLVAGQIDTAVIRIMNGDHPTFKWDKYGLRAYWFDTNDNYEINSIDSSKYVTFDHYGIYGIDNGSNFQPTSIEDVKKNASFGLTWDGFFLKTHNGTGSVSISSDNDFQVLKGDTELIKIGQLDTAADTYGIRIKDNSDNTVMQQDNSGQMRVNKLFIDGVLAIKTKGSTYKEFTDELKEGTTYYIINSSGVYEETNDTTRQDGVIYYTNEANAVSIGFLSGLKENNSNIHEVINANDSFIVYEDGSFEATEGNIGDNIMLGGETVFSIKAAAKSNVNPYTVIINADKQYFERTTDVITLTCNIYENGKIMDTTGKDIIYNWYNGSTPLSDKTGKEIELDYSTYSSGGQFTCWVII